MYKPAKIFSGKGDMKASWYVHFSYRKDAASKFERFRFTGEINRIHTYEERMAAAKVLQKLINLALENGFDPYLHGEDELENEILESGTLSTTIQELLAIKKSALKDNSAGTYSTHINNFLTWATSKGLDSKAAGDFTPINATQYLSYLQSAEMKLGPVTINANIDGISRIFEKMADLKIITSNPFTVVDALPTGESDRYEPLTDEEIRKIFAHLRVKNKELLLFAYFIYYCFLRPDSIKSIKISQIDFVNRTITIPSKSHKTRKPTTKQLLQPVYDLLLEFSIDKLDKTLFLFGEKLKPGTVKCRHGGYSYEWGKLVKSNQGDGLGIDKNIYALKHTGGSNYVNDNKGTINLPWLQKQMGHSSLKETQAYLAKMGFVTLDEGESVIRNF